MSLTAHRGKRILSALVAGALALGLGTIAPTAANAVVPAAVNIKLSDADVAHMTDKSYWWSEGGGSRSLVKFVEIGSVFTFTYKVTDAAAPNGPVEGAEVTLAPAAVSSSFTGSLTGTTNAAGEVTFTLTNTNTLAEPRPVAPSSMDYWDDSRSVTPEYKYDLTPSVTGATSTNRDRIWGHIVEAAPRVYTYDYANVKLTAADVAGMTDKSYWWHEAGDSRSMVKMLTAGDTLTLHYVVTNANSAPIANAAVTLEATKAHGDPSFTGSLSGTTNANGEVTFTLVNGDTADEAEPRPVAPSSMTFWDDSRGDAIGNTFLEMDFLPLIDAQTLNRDRVWTHIVDPSSDATLSALEVSGATLSPAFDAATLNYTASVSNASSTVDIKAVVSDAAATLMHNDVSVASGSWKPTSLAVGLNTINIKVTAGDGSTKTYVLTINRAAAVVASTVAIAGGKSMLKVTLGNVKGKTVYITYQVGSKKVSVTRKPTTASKVYTFAPKVKGSYKVSVKIGTKTVLKTVKVS